MLYSTDNLSQFLVCITSVISALLFKKDKYIGLQHFCGVLGELFHYLIGGTKMQVASYNPPASLGVSLKLIHIGSSILVTLNVLMPLCFILCVYSEENRRIYL